MQLPSTSEDYWCPAGEGARGISGNEWIALLKIANGDWSIPTADLACLLERKFVEFSTGFIRLTDDGQIALGVPV